MQVEKEGAHSGGLALFFRDSLRVTDRHRLEELLTQPQARELVRSAAYQDVFLIIKTIGLADCLDLLPLTTKQQRRGFVDLDCWRKDSFHLPSFMEWMAAFMHGGPEETVRMARAVDVKVLSLFLKSCIRVHLCDPEEPHPDLPLFLTPDGRFGVEITAEAERESVARLLLDAVFRFDPSLGYDLIDRVYWENRVCLEEEAYQDKRRRLEEIGFVDYYDALEIYGEADTEPASKEQRDTEKGFVVSSTLPAMFVASLAPGHYLREALQTIQNPQEAERISQGLAALANRLLSVYSVTPGDLNKVKPAFEEMRDTLSLSLEYLGQGQERLAGEALQHYDVQTLFKIGFNLVSQLHDQADRVFRRGNLRLNGIEDLLLEFPEAEFYSGVRRLRPLFFGGLEDPGDVTYRHFQRLADLELAKKLLHQVDLMSTGFWQMFGVPSARSWINHPSPVNLRPEELRFSQIFNTALVNFERGRLFVPSALSAKDVDEVLQQGWDLSRMTERFVSQAQSQVQTSIGDSEQRWVVSQFAKKWATACSEEMFLLSGKPVDSRFIRSLMIRLD